LICVAILQVGLEDVRVFVLSCFEVFMFS